MRRISSFANVATATTRELNNEEFDFLHLLADNIDDFKTVANNLTGILQAVVLLQDLATTELTFSNKVIDSITNLVGANHFHHPVRNISGSTIPAGTLITGNSTQSGTDYIEVIPVTDPQTQIAIGVTHSTLLQNDTGLAINTGILNDHVDTSMWEVGTILYPNTIGGFTPDKPTTGRYQACAVVTRSHQNQGTLLVEFTEPTYYASVDQAGIVQLDDTLSNTSTTKAATANAVKQLEDKKADRTELHASNVLGTKVVSEVNIGDGNILIFNQLTDQLEYTDTLDFGSIE